MRTISRAPQALPRSAYARREPYRPVRHVLDASGQRHELVDPPPSQPANPARAWLAALRRVERSARQQAGLHARRSAAWLARLAALTCNRLARLAVLSRAWLARLAVLSCNRLARLAALSRDWLARQEGPARWWLRQALVRLSAELPRLARQAHRLALVAWCGLVLMAGWLRAATFVTVAQSRALWERRPAGWPARARRADPPTLPRLEALPARRAAGRQEATLGPLAPLLVPLLATVGVMVMVLGAYQQLGADLAGGAAVPAPALLNRPLPEALEAARARGLEVEVVATRSSDSLARDLVLNQAPNPGALLRRGGTLRLTLSAGLRPPSVIGLSLDEARATLAQAGWSVAPTLERRPRAGEAPGTVVEQRPSADEAAPAKGPLTLALAAPDLAARRPVLTSAGAAAPEAVDGQERTVARPPSRPPSWLEVDLGGPTSVATVELLAALERPGPLVVEVWAWDATNRFFPLHLFQQEAADNQPLVASLTQPAPNVTRLRIATIASETALGWREVRVAAAQ